MNLESEFLLYRTNIFGFYLGSMDCCEVKLVADMAGMGNPVYYEMLNCLRFQLLSVYLGGEVSFTVSGDFKETALAFIKTVARDVYVAFTSSCSNFNCSSWFDVSAC